MEVLDLEDRLRREHAARTRLEREVAALKSRMDGQGRGPSLNLGLGQTDTYNNKINNNNRNNVHNIEDNDHDEEEMVRGEQHGVSRRGA